ncbi:MAG: 5'/3'-nucleotidase SurE [Deltaproteobacteria bacterium]|nr:5'/3'-nucleotidase SurE [Deltaproteobacteria bacterium]
MDRMTMPLVLSNDDGVNAEGLATLHSVLEPRCECLIVAPSGPQSGVGHAVTTDEPMRLEALGPQRFGLGGTPADCARVALGRSAAFARRELGETARASGLWLVAGINHGANLGVDTYVSGPAAAAREAAILGFPAIAISQYVGRHRIPDWSASAERARSALDTLLARPPRPGRFWNVNLPHPANESVRHDLVFCPLDPSPHAFRYEDRGGDLHWVSDFHARPRLAGHDIDICMGGRISITEIPIQPVFDDPKMTPD